MIMEILTYNNKIMMNYVYIIYIRYLYILDKNTRKVNKIDNIVTKVETSLANFGLENIVENANEKLSTVLLYKKQTKNILYALSLKP